MNNEVLLLIFQGVIGFGVSLVGWGVREIYFQLREMNGNVRDLKAWRNIHQPQEEKWHEENREDHKSLWEEIKAMHEKVWR